MIAFRDIAGRRSRTMDTAQLIAVLGAVETGFTALKVYIPDDWLWVHGVALMALGAWLAYLRTTTTTPLA